MSKNNSLTLSFDTLNLTKLNTKKDKWIVYSRSFGIDYSIKERNVKYKIKKEKGPVMRFSLNIKIRRSLFPKNVLK